MSGRSESIICPSEPSKETVSKHIKSCSGAGLWLIEGLNLSHISPGEYDLVCLPLKIQGGDGAPARAALRAR